MPHISDPTIKTRLLLRPVKSALGTIRLGGINQGGFGVGHPTPRTVPCYGIVQILNGSGIYSDRQVGPMKVENGDLVIFFPNQPHRCSARPGELWDELWFEFEGPAFDLMRKTGLLDPRRPVHHPHNAERWFKRFFQIIPPLHLREKTPPQVIISRFIAVLTEILADSDAPDDIPTAQDDWVTVACELLGAHQGAHGLVPEAVAKKLGFSYETFRKRFKEAVGSAPGRYHLDARIDRAAALLHQGKHTIREIADQLQFCDEFYFSRCFKRRFGQSPRAFRKRVRG